MSFPAALLEVWGIASVDSVEVPTLGTMNETWIVRSGGMPVVLRRHRHRPRSAVEFEHSVIDHARAHGVPCPRVIPSLDEGRIVERSGRLHSLYSWERGSHAPKGRAGPDRAYEAGMMLARIHDALASIPDGPRDSDALGDLAATFPHDRT